jgi:hypothetical protein
LPKRRKGLDMQWGTFRGLAPRLKKGSCGILTTAQL